MPLLRALCIGLAVFLTLVSLGLAIAAIWSSGSLSERLGSTGGLTFLIAIPVGCAVAFLSED